MNHTDIVVERVASVSTYTSSGVSVVGAFTANEIAAIGGLVVAVFAAAINWYYRHKTYLHDKKLTEAKLNQLKGEK